MRKQSRARGLVILLVVLGVLLVIPYGKTDIVDTTTEPSAVDATPGRKQFYAVFRHWVFYVEDAGTDMLVYTSSPDADTWDTPTGINVVALGYGGEFGVVLEEPDYVHLTYCNDADLFYRRGTLGAEGVITWEATQTVYNGNANDIHRYPTIILDSEGYAWIGTEHYVAATYDRPGCIRNSKKDGTWTTAAGFPYHIHTDSHNSIRTGLVPLDGGAVYAHYAWNSNPCKGRLWNGSWGALETISSANVEWGSNHDGVGLGRRVHMVYKLDTSFHLIYRTRYVNGSWSAEYTVEASTDTWANPSITTVRNRNYLIVFWCGHPTAHHLFYRERIDNVWQARVDWIDETVGTVWYNRFTSSYTNYGNTVGYYGLGKPGSPYDVIYHSRRVWSVPYPVYLNITNMEKPTNIIKTDYIEYNVEAKYVVANDTLGIRWSAGSQTYEIYYSIQDDNLTYNGDGHFYARLPSLTTDGDNQTLRFKLYLMSHMRDQADIDFYLRCNITTGDDSGWILSADNYCDLLSYSGITKFTFYNTSGRLSGGDWLNLYAEANSSARVEYIDNNIQGIFMTLGLNPGYGMTNNEEEAGTFVQAGRYVFGMDYSINGTGWIDGWDVTLRPYNVSLDANNNYVTFKAEWDNGGTSKTDYVAGYWYGHDTGDDRINFVIRLWFNRENGSSVVGGWVQPLEYGLTDTSPWWNPFGSWQPVRSFKADDVPAQYVDTPTYSSFFFVPMKNGSDIICYKDIDTVRFWAEVYGHAGLPANDQFRIESVTKLEIVRGGMQDSHASMGIPTPAPIEPIIITHGFFSGLMRWLGAAVYSVFRGVQSKFMDGIDWVLMVVTGQEGVFSSFIRMIQMFAGNIFQMMTTYMRYVAENIDLVSRVLGISYRVMGFFGRVITAMRVPGATIWTAILDVCRIINAWGSGISFTASWGNTYDFTNMSGIHYGGYTAGYAVIWGMMMFYLVLVPVRMGMALGNDGLSGMINVIYEPVFIIWKVSTAIWWAVSAPVKAILAIISIIRG